MKRTNKKILGYAYVALGLMTALSFQAYAAGYKLEFQSASTLADAGDAAVVEDAGTNWYNSAGLVYLPQQWVVSGIDLYEQTKFSGTTQAPAPRLPFPSVGSGFSAAGTASSYPNSRLPAIHYVYPFKERWAVGISIVPAWGLAEDYGQNSLLRYDLIRVYTKTIDIAPSAAMKINDQWSVGLGPDFHYFSIQSKNNVRTEGSPPFGTVGDSLSRFSADDWNTGWHAGLLFRLNDTTRFGVNYRSKIVMHTEGYSDFILNGVTQYETNRFGLNITLPPTTSFSIYHDVTQRWALMGTISYDQWSTLKDYNAQNYIQPPTAPGGPPSFINVSLPQGMSNTFDLGVGTHYVLNEQWMLRGSVKYEPTPTNNAYRDVNFPDGSKLGFQVGARYQINKKLAVDLIYGHVFVKTASINATNPITYSNANGHVNTNINLAGAQLVWNV
jgi:long-chain fatty acid transport protein